MCAAIAVDKNSVVVEVVDVCLSLPRDVPLEPPDTQPQLYWPLYELRGECRRCRARQDVPRGDFEGQELLAFVEVIADVQG